MMIIPAWRAGHARQSVYATHAASVRRLKLLTFETVCHESCFEPFIADALPVYEWCRGIVTNDTTARCFSGAPQLDGNCSGWVTSPALATAMCHYCTLGVKSANDAIDAICTYDYRYHPMCDSWRPARGYWFHDMVHDGIATVVAWIDSVLMCDLRAGFVIGIALLTYLIETGLFPFALLHSIARRVDTWCLDRARKRTAATASQTHVFLCDALSLSPLRGLVVDYLLPASDKVEWVPAPLVWLASRLL
jgi:hypothetical protein